MLDIKSLRCVSKNVDLDEYIKFREEVKKNMEYPEWLGDFSKEDIIEMLDTGAKIFVYYLDKEPVCSMMFIPSSEKSATKFGLKLDSKKIGDYGPMFVNPKYVGNRLQYQMLLEMDRYCLENEYTYGISTVHPDNIYSMNNLLKDGFICIGQRSFKRGIRNIYLKCLDKEYIEKVLTFVVCGNKVLALKGSNTDPQFHESFWYTVTGSVEKEDKNLEDAVAREVYEETGLKVLENKKILLTFEYSSLGKMCIEHAFVSFVDKEDVVLNEESIDYAFLDLDEFVDRIKWYYDKEELKSILAEYVK